MVAHQLLHLVVLCFEDSVGVMLVATFLVIKNDCCLIKEFIITESGFVSPRFSFDRFMPTFSSLSKPPCFILFLFTSF